MSEQLPEYHAVGEDVASWGEGELLDHLRTGGERIPVSGTVFYLVQWRSVETARDQWEISARGSFRKIPKGGGGGGKSTPKDFFGGGGGECPPLPPKWRLAETSGDQPRPQDMAGGGGI